MFTSSESRRFVERLSLRAGGDGTLWVEQPLPKQFDFVFRKWAAEAEADPSLAAQQPYKAIIEKDEAFFAM